MASFTGTALSPDLATDAGDKFGHGALGTKLASALACAGDGETEMVPEPVPSALDSPDGGIPYQVRTVTARLVT